MRNLIIARPMLHGQQKGATPVPARSPLPYRFRNAAHDDANPIILHPWEPGKANPKTYGPVPCGPRADFRRLLIFSFQSHGQQAFPIGRPSLGSGAFWRLWTCLLLWPYQHESARRTPLVFGPHLPVAVPALVKGRNLNDLCRPWRRRRARLRDQRDNCAPFLRPYLHRYHRRLTAEEPSRLQAELPEKRVHDALRDGHMALADAG